MQKTPDEVTAELAVLTEQRAQTEAAIQRATTDVHNAHGHASAAAADVETAHEHAERARIRLILASAEAKALDATIRQMHRSQEEAALRDTRVLAETAVTEAQARLTTIADDLEAAQSAHEAALGAMQGGRTDEAYTTATAAHDRVQALQAEVQAARIVLAEREATWRQMRWETERVSSRSATAASTPAGTTPPLRSPLGFHEGRWGNQPHFTCDDCPFSSLSASAVHEHVREKHPHQTPTGDVPLLNAYGETVERDPSRTAHRVPVYGRLGQLVAEREV